MKRFKQILKNNVLLFIGIVIGIVVVGTTTYAATILFQGDEVGYDNTDSGFKDSSGNNVTDVQTALDELYTKASSIKNPGDLVYFDPVSTSACNASTFNLTNVKNGTSTCYKWRIISSIGNDLILQMDHNLINKVAWVKAADYSGSSTSANDKGPITTLKELATRTSGWVRVEKLNYTYNTTEATNNYGILSCVSGVCSTIKNGTTTVIAGSSETPLRARIITAEEIVAITNSEESVEDDAISKTWNLASTSQFYFSRSSYKIGTQTSGTGNTNLSWLVENTATYASSGATLNEYDATNDGYWTLSPRSYRVNGAWSVRYLGCLFNNGVISTSNCGARPVITVSKSLVS